MADRFMRDDDAVASNRTATTTEARTRVDEPGRVDLPPRLPERDGDGRLVDGTLDRGTLSAVRARQREEFGGIAWGSAFFGWLAATGLGAILAGIAAAVGAALSLTETAADESIGIGGGVALLVVLFASYFAGGYVAGRMARFDGARQGVGVVVWAIVLAAVLAVAAVIGGQEYNVLERVDLPRLPVDEGTLTTGGAIALAAGLLTMLVAAVLGGKTGERFHRKVDRAALEA